MGGVRISIEDVLLDSAVENVVLLQHEADVLAQEFRVVFAQVDAVKGNNTRLRLVELVQEVHNGALARTRQTHQCRDLVRLNGHIHIEKGLVAIGIGEIDIFHFELAVDLFWLVAARWFHFLFCVKDTKEALGIDQSIVHVIEDALQLCDGCDDIAEQHHMVHDFTDGHAGVVY